MPRAQTPRAGLTVLLSAAASFAAAANASAEVLWTTNPDIPTTFSAWLVGPSALTPALDQEVADDFNVVGSIERVVADGEDCNDGCFGGQPVTGVHVRFYAWTAEGPGALQAAFFLPEGDPGFHYDTCCGPELLSITLPEPFMATGWHFVSVQVALDGTAPADRWHFHRTNVGAPMGAPAAVRSATGGTWTAFHGTVGWPALDASFRLEGTPGGSPPPQMLSAMPDPVTPSGRLRISGDAFGTGAAGATLRIDGRVAPVTQWDDDTIIAYVPEDTAPGAAQVELVVDDAVVDTLTMTVVAREPDGRVRWRFAVDSDYVAHRVGVGPDGSVAILDLHGRLYQLDPDGGLAWIVDALRGQTGLGAEGPVIVGDDGTIYAVVNPLGPTTDIVAYGPDGTLRWVFTDPASWGAAVGPAIGPDGHVYVAFHALGGTSLGLVSLTTDGALRWSNGGDPYLYEHAAVGAELAFGASTLGGAVDQVVLTVDRDLDGYVYAFDMTGGDQHWAVPRGVVEDLFLQYQIQPDVGLDGMIYTTEFTGSGGLGWGMKALRPEDGTLAWRFDPGIASGASGPAVGPDGTIYVSWDISRVSKVDTSGNEVWRHVDLDGVRSRPTVDPTNELVFVAGGTFGAPGRLKALDVATGGERWRVALPHENGDVVPDAAPSFAPDAATAYLPTVILADPEPYQYCYVYALQLDEPVAGDVDGDGMVGVSDLLAVLAAWGPCAGCAADLDGSGSVDVGDLLLVLGHWS